MRDEKITKEVILSGNVLISLFAPNEQWIFRVKRVPIHRRNPKKVPPNWWRDTYNFAWSVYLEDSDGSKYLGVLRKVDTLFPWVEWNRKSAFKIDSRPFAIARWALGYVWRNELENLPKGYGLSVAAV